VGAGAERMECPLSRCAKNLACLSSYSRSRRVRSADGVPGAVDGQVRSRIAGDTNGPQDPSGPPIDSRLVGRHRFLVLPR
jgi:hypothetical protein